MAAKAQEGLRAEALKRLRARRQRVNGLAAYAIVNAVLVVIWAVTGQGYFWPGWVLGCWGFLLLLGAWSAWSPFFVGPITDEDVDREVERLRRRSGGGTAAA